MREIRQERERDKDKDRDKDRDRERQRETEREREERVITPVINISIATVATWSFNRNVAQVMNLQHDINHIIS